MTKRDLIRYLESLKVPDDTPIMTDDYEYGISDVVEQGITVKEGELDVTIYSPSPFGSIKREKRSGTFIIIS